MKKEIFISYSWDGNAHQDWVKDLADQLEEFFEIHVHLDRYDLDSFSDKDHFMEAGVSDSDIILVVATPSYVDKANSRRGGVGIETKLSAARHWREASAGESRIIPLLRSGDRLPNYLGEKLYIDFRDGVVYEESFEKLLGHIKSVSRDKRPKKKASIHAERVYQNLTRAEDFLKMNHKRRVCIFSSEQTRDYSSGRRIKFELWETLSPSIHYFLFLYDNVTIKSTVERLGRMCREKGVVINQLTVLKTGGSEKGYLSGLLKKNGIDAEVNELSYQDYFWEFCIDDEAKDGSGVFQNPYFIDQSLVSKDDGSSEVSSAYEFLKSELLENAQSAASVIIAPGGTGKTTLCQYIINQYKGADHVIPVLLQAEEIKSRSSLLKVPNKSIKTVYDLYDVYYSACADGEDNEYVFDKVTFEVALLTGKLLLVIDGLDEFVSLLPDAFNVDLFMESIEELNQELASSKVVITTRNDILSETLTQRHSGIKKYELLGFDIDSCRKYLQKRFRDKIHGEAAIKKIVNSVEDLISSHGDDRILPFVVDLLSSLVDHQGSKEEFSFRLSFDGKPYESNEEITDYLVYSVFRRESIRQSLEISIQEMLDIFLELSINNSEYIPKAEIENIISIFYAENAKSLTGKILRNPLLEVAGDDCKFKYDFISDYFKSLKIISAINSESFGDDILKLVARHAYGDDSVYGDVCKYYLSRKDVFYNRLKSIVSKVKVGMSANDVFEVQDYKFRAFGFFVNLLSEINSGYTKTDLTHALVDIFGDNGVIENLGVYGKFAPLDFSDQHVIYSRFVGYKGFNSSKFSRAKFSNCYFDDIQDSKCQADVKADMFDSCIMGDLNLVIENVSLGKKQARDLKEEELRKFLGSFFKRNKFRDQKKSYIKFSDRVKGIDKLFFERLKDNKIIEVKVEKSDETYYQISKGFQNSVYSFLINNNFDNDMKKIFDLIPS